MSSFQKIARLSAVAAAVVLAAPAFANTTTDVSANAEFDTGFQSGDNKAANGSSQVGRIEINVSGKAEANGYFVAGRGTVLAGNAGNNAGVDDAWVQAGSAAFDVKLGRFEAADLYATPGDVFRIGGAGLGTTNLLRGRTTYSTTNNDRLHMALTANVAPGVSIEVGVVDTKEVASGAVGGKGGAKGIRPSVGFAFGAFSARVGFETGKVDDTTTVATTDSASFTTFGGTAKFDLGGGMAVRANASSGKVKSGTEVKNSTVLLGFDVAGLNLSVESGKTTTGATNTKTTGLFAAYTLPLFDIKGATIAPAVGSYKDKPSAGTSTSQTKVGFRVHYDF
ncbi:MAG: carbohydrate porin [Leptothrix sp. (in: b-proteobacteria)]